MDYGMEQRRQMRAQQKKARAEKRRRNMLRLLAVLGILIVAAVIIILFANSGKKEAPVSKPSDGTSPTELPPTVIHLVFAGDLNVTPGTIASGGEYQDYSRVFLDVAPILAGGDLTVLNFEGSAGAVPQSMLQALSSAGVDMLQLANSYAISDGILGLASGIDAVNAAGMEPLGVYRDSAAARAGKGYTIREVNGVRIAFVAFTKGMDGMTLPAGSQNCVNILYKDYDSTYQSIDTNRITGVLDAVAKESPDLTVALLHWGSEFNDTISTSQEKIRDLMYSHGVDAIIGTHPHYVQSIEQNAENGNFIAYSLGDFFGDASRNGSEYSVILDLEVTKTGETTVISDYSFTPIYTVRDEEKPVAVLRIAHALTAFESQYISRVPQEVFDSMKNAQDRVIARTAPKTDPKDEEKK